MKGFEVVLLLNLGLWAGGCQYILGGIELESAKTAVEPPANVAAYLSVMNGREPITDLTANDFQISEDGAALNPTETKQVLLNPGEVADHRVLVLVDMGSPDSARAVSRGAALLLSRVVGHHGVLVFAFDGDAELHPIAEFERTFDRTAIPEEFESLTQWKPADGARDLNGALVAAIGQLKNKLAESPKPIRVGTVVLFARGPDTAGKVSPQLRDETVTTSGFDVHAIGVQSEDPDFDLTALGPSGVETTKVIEDIAIAFEQTATTLAARSQSYYLLSYCSPSRAGVHQLKVEVSDTEPDGTEQRGSWTLSFDATGFGPGCNASRMPGFGRISSPSTPSSEPAGPSAESPPPASGSAEPEPQASPSSRPLPPRYTAPAPSSPPSHDSTGQEQHEDGVVPPPAGSGYAPMVE